MVAKKNWSTLGPPPAITSDYSPKRSICYSEIFCELFSRIDRQVSTTDLVYLFLGQATLWILFARKDRVLVSSLCDRIENVLVLRTREEM